MIFTNMFLKLLFKRLKLKENKYFMAVLYGLIYGIVIFFLLLASSLYLGRLDLMKTVSVSIAVWAVMSIVYLIKWEVFTFLKK